MSRPPNHHRSSSEATIVSDTQIPFLRRYQSASAVTEKNNVVAPAPWLTYGSVLVSLTIVVLSLLFYGYMLRNGGIPARPGLAEWVEGNARTAALLVTMLSTFLAAILKWTLGEVFALVAQKRFLKFQTIFEIEVWSALRNFAIIWPWGEKRKNRWAAMPMSVAVVGICGVLTSVFVALLSPLRVSLQDPVIGDAELDFSVNSSVCETWYKANVIDGLKRNKTCRDWTEYKGFKYQRCDTTLQMLDVLEAGKASMLAYIDKLSPPAKDVPNPVYALSRLGNTRILGSTAGVVPIGLAGIKAFGARTEGTNISLDSLSNMQLAPKPNYTVTLQGLWTDVSCEYVDLPQLPISWPPIYNETTKTLYRNVICPSEPQGYYQAAITTSDNALHVYECPAPGGPDWNYYLHSYFAYNEALNWTSTDSYAGIGSMKCTVSPRLRNINTTYHSHSGAFTMEPIDEVTQIPVLDIFRYVAFYSWYIFSNAQTPDAGSLVAYVIDTWAVSRLGLPGGVKDPRYPGVVASMLKGIFEYQATSFRLLLETSPNRPPAECLRPVGGSVQYFVIGWDAARVTGIGLVFAEILAVLMVVLMYYSKNGELTIFDPTNPISLIAASSAGGVTFGQESIGDPMDHEVRGVKVKYGLVEETRKWGLIMEPGNNIPMADYEQGAVMDKGVDAP